MKKSAQVFFSFLLAIIITSCSSVPNGQKPAWADSVNQVFPPEKYITALGYADTQEMAMNVADANLASYFSKEISSFTTATQSLSNTQGTKENLSREITIKSQIELFGIKHTECYFESQSKNYVVCAYISREDVWSVLEPKLNIHYSSFSKNIAQVKNQKGLKAVINANKLLSNTSEFEDLYYMALCIFPNSCEKYSNLMEDMMILKQQIHIAEKEIRIRINIKGDSENRIYSKISSLVSESGFTVCKSGENHIMNVDVDITEQITGKIHAVYPKISVEISDRKEIISSFSKSFEKVASFNSITVQKMALSRIEEFLEQELVKSCLK